MKLVTVVGARPQFIKASVMSRAIRDANQKNDQDCQIQDVIIHTGQHYDHNMSATFFEELAMPQPAYNLGINQGQHGAMTGQMLEQVEQVLLQEKPDRVILYGDTNSTLAGALAASKLRIPIAHVEAGLRSFNRDMPEEINRVLTDHVSDWLFCPCESSRLNLANEGITRGVQVSGDIMLDSFYYYVDQVSADISDFLASHNLQPNSYVLATCHRQENTDQPALLRAIFEAFDEIARLQPVVLPLHPRTRKMLEQHGLTHLLSRLHILEPQGYRHLIILLLNAALVMTDSGGLQKEAYFAKAPCITLRQETEWTETLEHNCNILTGADKTRILQAYAKIPGLDKTKWQQPYGDGHAGRYILQALYEVAGQEQ